MEDCVFCKIIKGEIDSAKIWEDGDFLAFLDLNPNMKGMTLVVPKKHFESDLFKMGSIDYLNLFTAAKKTVDILKRGLNVTRVVLVVEGLGAPHAHIKLYPLHGSEADTQNWVTDKVYFEKYPGYITTLCGEQKELSELKKLAQEIRSKN